MRSPPAGRGRARCRSKIVRSQSGPSSDAGQHARPDLVVVVEGECKVRPAFTGEHAMRSRRAFHRPAMRRGRAVPWWPARCSRCMEKVGDLRDRFSVLKTISEHAEREHLISRERVLSARAVCHHTGKGDDFGDPPPVVFTLDFHHEFSSGHTVNVPASTRRRQDTAAKVRYHDGRHPTPVSGQAASTMPRAGSPYRSVSIRDRSIDATDSELAGSLRNGTGRPRGHRRRHPEARRRLSRTLLVVRSARLLSDTRDEMLTMLDPPPSRA